MQGSDRYLRKKNIFKFYVPIILLLLGISYIFQNGIREVTNNEQVEERNNTLADEQKTETRIPEKNNNNVAGLDSTLKQGQNLKEIDRDSKEKSSLEFSTIPAFNQNPFVEINDNSPFNFENVPKEGEIRLSELDSLGRCGFVFANIGAENFPTEERGEIGGVKPSGWHVDNYHELVEGNYLYNRCHLIGYQLSGINADERNLITGTRYLNVSGMLPFENLVADYIAETGAHVLYRVTPIFYEDELVARGVLMEAESYEDRGNGVCFCVYCYNSQPGIRIDYKTGENELDTSGVEIVSTNEVENEEIHEYVVNHNTKKFHKSGCKNADTIKQKNREDTKCRRQELIDQGYKAAGCCNP